MSLTGKDTRTSTKTPDRTFGVYGDSEGGYGVVGLSLDGVAVYGESGEDGTTGSESIGVEGYSPTGLGVFAAGGYGGVYAQGDTGVVARGSAHGTAIDALAGSVGVLARTENGIGLHASGTGSGTGVHAESANGTALIADGKGTTMGTGIGVHTFGTQAALVATNAGAGTAATLAGTAVAGQFTGDVVVSGLVIAKNFVATMMPKMFQIDHPLDPERKVLRHATVESSEIKNLYDGVVVLDEGGKGVVELPTWFEALNGDFRYQLTCLGAHAPVYVADEIRDRRFRIAGGTPGLKVSWLVTGVRRDPAALAHPLRVEEDKAEGEQGLFLNPAAYGLPAERGIWAQPAVAAALPPSPPPPPAELPAPLRQHLHRRKGSGA